MKALIVADDERAISNIREVLKVAGYDTIVYKWMLKALDNIEEIAPHLIVVSTKDYPRHWKTLAQYSTIGFGDYLPEIILYADESFSEEELKKAEQLRVRGIFHSIEVEGLDELREILVKHEDIFSGLLTEPEQQEINVSDIIPDFQPMKGEDQASEENQAEDEEEFSEDEEVPTIKSILDETETPEDETIEEEEEEESVSDTEINDGLSFTEESVDDEVSEDETQTNSSIQEEQYSEDFTPVTEESENLDTDEDTLNENETFLSNSGETYEENIDAKEISDFVENTSDFEDNAVTSEELTALLTNPDQDFSAQEENVENTDFNSQDNITTDGEEDMAEENSIEAKLAEIMNANKNDSKEKAEADDSITSSSCSFVFTNPITLAMVSGTARGYNGMTLEFSPDIDSFIMNLGPGTQINTASLKTNGKIEDVKAEVMTNDGNRLYLQIKK